MIPPATPVDEPERLETLRSLRILDTEPEERFDRLTRLAKRLFGVPIVLVSLIDADRQWFKSKQGLAISQTPRKIAMCGHAILGDDVMLVPDTLLDERFHDHPLVTGEPFIRFYAGCPLRAANGSKLGTFCLIDRQPRHFDADADDGALLRDLATMAEQEIATLQLATMDELTLLSNRRGFLSLGQHALGLCTRMSLPVTMLFFDLDGFKQINDRFGHAEGDRALTAFAAILLQTFRDSDVVGRLGGDEFVVLLTNCPEADSDACLARLRHAVAAGNDLERRGYDIRFTVGAVSREPAAGTTVETLLAEADALMYECKRLKQAH